MASAYDRKSPWARSSNGTAAERSITTMRVALDLSHSRVWTADPKRRTGGHSTREYTELGYVAHLPEIFDGFAERTQIIDRPWTAETLARTDVLLMPTGGREADRPVTAEESALLANFLDGGGGILAFGDGDRPPTQPSESLTSAVARFSFGGIFVSQQRPTAEHLLTYDVTCAAVPGHPIMGGIDTVHLHRARPIKADMTALLSHAGHTVAGAATRGDGRIVVVSNADMFTLPFLGRRDNLLFLLNAISWLATGQVEASVGERHAEKVRGQAFATRSFDPEPCLARASGPHVIDASALRAELDPITATELPDSNEDDDAFIAAAELCFHELPRSIRHTVGTFRERSNDYGILLVSGLPLGASLPPTPVDPHARPHRKRWLSELWLAAFASALGSPFTYLQEQSGSLFQNVVPTPENANKISSESSSILLGFHTEMGFHPYPPDYLLLLCLRPDHDNEAKTITAGVRMILSRLTLCERAILFEPLYRPGIDYSFGSPNATEGNGPAVPILYGDPHDPFLNFDLDLMVGLTEEAEAAVQALRTAANQVRRWVRLSTGDLLVIDNRRAVHARSEFTARYDGQDRWLQRMCVTRDLAASAAERAGGGRTVETTFAF
ncbi:hypothetical protein FXF68_00970 [Actinomadura decatromicini]|uniref:TauD/TfdA-like domain-containing protein n=2 Tax=Actinomadura decatromicini TaxID=2604572 RepID=A0A5D3FWW5_9ACTN|nr:hypothetical protein FXF68_00970 [Actinomadura decatromicini]